MPFICRTTVRFSLASLLVSLVLTSPVYAQSPDLVVHRLMGNSQISLVRDYLGKDYDNILSDVTRLVEHPASAPLTYAESFRSLGLADVGIDARGNVLGYWKGSGNGRTIVVAVRLPHDSSPNLVTHVRKEDTRWFAPGIAQRYPLAVLFGWVRAMKAAAVKTSNDILFVATPDDDAERRLLENDAPEIPFSSVVALETRPPRDIVTATPALRRYRIDFQSQDAGQNVTTLLSFLQNIPSVHLTRQMTPPESLELEVRSESVEDLDRTSTEIAASLNRISSGRDGNTNMRLLSDEAPARTHVSLNLVQLATAVMTESGFEPVYRTDVSTADVAMRLHIPSIAIGCGVHAGAPDSADEWIETSKQASVRAATVSLAVVLSAAGVKY